MKKPFIIANWKCNPATLKEAKLLFDQIKDTGAIICPPHTYLTILGANGAQDLSWENPPTDGGAYTGEVSALMLKNLGVKYVIVGHSERRKHCHETNEMIFKKIKAALTQGLKPILCIDKISQIYQNLSKEVIIAYEPLFAIGTGRACSFKKAGKMRAAIGQVTGGKNQILYGGSVNARNAKNYVCRAGFQGLLVGRASLNPKEFIDIVKNV